MTAVRLIILTLLLNVLFNHCESNKYAYSSASIELSGFLGEIYNISRFSLPIRFSNAEEGDILSLSYTYQSPEIDRNTYRAIYNYDHAFIFTCNTNMSLCIKAYNYGPSIVYAVNGVAKGLYLRNGGSELPKDIDYRNILSLNVDNLGDYKDFLRVMPNIDHMFIKEIRDDDIITLHDYGIAKGLSTFGAGGNPISIPGKLCKRDSFREMYSSIKSCHYVIMNDDVPHLRKLLKGMNKVVKIEYNGDYHKHIIKCLPEKIVTLEIIIKDNICNLKEIVKTMDTQGRIAKNMKISIVRLGNSNEVGVIELKDMKHCKYMGIEVIESNKRRATMVSMIKIIGDVSLIDMKGISIENAKIESSTLTMMKGMLCVVLRNVAVIKVNVKEEYSKMQLKYLALFGTIEGCEQIYEIGLMRGLRRILLCEESLKSVGAIRAEVIEYNTTENYIDLTRHSKGMKAVEIYIRPRRNRKFVTAKRILVNCGKDVCVKVCVQSPRLIEIYSRYGIEKIIYVTRSVVMARLRL